MGRQYQKRVDWYKECVCLFLSERSFGNLYGLSNQTINSFFQDSDGIVWVGTDGGGINRFDPVSGTFKHYPATKYEKVVSIVEYTPDELLFFSFNKGLFIFHKQTGQIRPFVLIDKEMNDQTCINGFLLISSG